MHKDKSASPLKYALLGALTAIGLASFSVAQAVPVGDQTELKGKVAQYSLNAHGALEGLILADGAEIRIPPHIATQLAFSVRPGDAVTIRGFRTSANPNLTVATVTNDTTGAVVDADPSATSSKISVESRIKMQLHDPEGRLNGVLLDDGTVVRMPPADAEQHAGELAVDLPLAVSGDEISTPLGRVIAAREFGPSKTQVTKIDEPRFEHWMHGSDIVSPPGKVDAEGQAVSTQAVIEQIEAALAARGVKVAVGNEQGPGASVTATIPGTSGHKAGAEADSGRADTEIATQSNAPLVIKSSGPVTIDIGAVIVNSND